MQINEHIDPTEIPENIKLDEKKDDDRPKTPDFDKVIQGRNAHSYSSRGSAVRRMIQERVWFLGRKYECQLNFWAYSNEFKVTKYDTFVPNPDDAETQKIMSHIRTLTGILHETYDEYDD